MTGNTERDGLSEVTRRFPQSESRIQYLFDNDEDFRELCSDYAECLIVLERLRQQKTGPDPRLEDYCEARVTLEQELLSRLSNRNGRALKPGTLSGNETLN
jgi:hypothetical protein